MSDNVSGDGTLNSIASLEQCQLALPSGLSQGVPCSESHQTWFSGAFSFREEKGHWYLAHRGCPHISLRKGHSCRLRPGRQLEGEPIPILLLFPKGYVVR